MNPDFNENFRTTVQQAYEQLSAIPEEKAAAKPDSKQWSIKEILGHLVDSASNNHQRIVRLQIFDAIEFPFYQQDDFVRVNHYQSQAWESLLEFWRQYNLHILHLIENIDRTKLDNFWITPEKERLTLQHIIEDYLRHVKHHLTQISGRNQ